MQAQALPEKQGKALVGKVVSCKMQKSAVVVIDRRRKHKRLGKYMTYSTRLYVHDAEDACRVGDTVKIRAVRPLSKNKRWVLETIVDSVV